MILFEPLFYPTGLVAISASCSVVELGGALAVGVVASILCTSPWQTMFGTTEVLLQISALDAHILFSSYLNGLIFVVVAATTASLCMLCQSYLHLATQP